MVHSSLNAMKKKRSIFQTIAIWLALVIVFTTITLASFIAIDGLTDELEPVDVAVVMGTTVNPDGTPSPWLRTHLDRAVELYRQGYFAHIIVSGGTDPNGQNEAVGMRDYLVSKGIPTADIWLDQAGYNTYATAKNTSLIMQSNRWQSVMVVTQFYHVPRTKLALRRIGITPVYGAHARWITWQSAFWLLREVAAFPAYLLRGY